MTTRALDLVRAATEPRHTLNLLEVVRDAARVPFFAHTFNYDGHDAPGVTFKKTHPFHFGIAVPAQGNIWLFACGSKDPILMHRSGLTAEIIKSWVTAIMALWTAENTLSEKISDSKFDFCNQLRRGVADASVLDKFEEGLWFDGTDFKVS